MPLTRISLLRGKPPEYRRAIADAVYAAMREDFGVPADDLFTTITQHDPGDIVYTPEYLGIEHDDDIVIIQITANNTRTVEKKQAFFASIADRLAKNPGIAPNNVIINLIDVMKENWSFGNGIAQYVDPPTQ